MIGFLCKNCWECIIFVEAELPCTKLRNIIEKIKIEMVILLKKELKYFLSSVVGYIIIGTFLVLTGLLLWFLPGEYNVINSGYANLDAIFILSPWLFLFLSPAISMRLFAEEKQNGTIDLLLTKPIGRWSILLSKFFAGWIIELIALLPILLWFYSISTLANPVGNVDSGAFWGSFVGLIMLAAIYMSIGIFASSLSVNQVVAFIVSAVLNFFMYYGFDMIGQMLGSSTLSYFIQQFGISSHYDAMSRGVLDSRDIVYFIFVTIFYLCMTKQIIKRKINN